MNLLWEIIGSIGIMLVVILIALTPSVHDNLHFKRIERQRRRWRKKSTIETKRDLDLAVDEILEESRKKDPKVLSNGFGCGLNLSNLEVKGRILKNIKKIHFKKNKRGSNK